MERSTPLPDSPPSAGTKEVVCERRKYACSGLNLWPPSVRLARAGPAAFVRSAQPRVRLAIG